VRAKVERFLIRGASRIITPIEEVGNAAILVEGSKIARIGPEGEFGDELPSIDVGGRIVLPGFVDIHVHGGGGADAADGTPEAIAAIARTHARFGTTALLATTVSAPWPQVIKAVRAIREAAGRGVKGGARVLGLHLEGPFLSRERRGAHLPEFLLVPTEALIEEVFEAAGGYWRMVTLAPEVCPPDIIRQLTARGVVVAMGHSNADYERAIAAIREGATHAIHTFNGMSPLHHRQPGLVGAVLTSDQVTAEIIADGVHVHPVVVNLFLRCKGLDKAVLITDAIRAAGLPEGVYEVAGQEVVVKDGAVRRPDGGLAGSILTMNRAVANARKFGGLALREAVKLATLNPARVVGAHDRKGSLEPGKDADLVVVDEALNVYLTMVEGEVVYRAEGSAGD